MSDEAMTKQVDDGAGFITAFWASFGIAIMGLAAMERDPMQFLMDHWLTAIFFVFAIYSSSYLVGGRIFARERIRRNPLFSFLAAIFVSEVVLVAGVLFGGIGSCVMHASFDAGAVLGAVLVIGVYGLMFTVPLSIGLGGTIWVRNRVREREDVSITDVMS